MQILKMSKGNIKPNGVILPFCVRFYWCGRKNHTVAIPITALEVNFSLKKRLAINARDKINTPFYSFTVIVHILSAYSSIYQSLPLISICVCKP